MTNANLEAAIVKWDAIAAGKEADYGPCMLCQVYERCCTCVVHIATGDGCDGTPFATWCNLAVKTGQWNTRISAGVRAITPEMVNAALQMAEFLRGLREVKTNKIARTT